MLSNLPPGAGPVYSIPVVFHVQADSEMQAAELLAEDLIGSGLVRDADGRQTGAIESWEMPNQRWVDRSDPDYHLAFVPDA